MNNIDDSGIQKIMDLSVNVGMTYLKWAGIHSELTTKQFREEYDCCDELQKVLNNFDPDGDKKFDSNRLVVMTHRYLINNYSQKHADLYRIGFSVVQQTLGLAARLFSSDEEDSAKSIADILPEHMKNLKSRLEDVLPPDIITNVTDLITNKIEEVGLELDIGDLLVQVFNEVAFSNKRITVTVTMGEEQKTYQTFRDLIGGLLNYGVEKFTRECKSVDDLNNAEKFKETIGLVTDDFLNKNMDILKKHQSNFIDELNQDRSEETRQSLPSVKELVSGAICGMAEGYWLKCKK